MAQSSAIALFDSGIGGLTVLRAIAERMPDEDLIYLGDTARLPYGSKSGETVTRYAVQATRALMRYDVKLIVIACNTASAVALPVLAAALDPVPVLGVVEPGARAAAAASRGRGIGVLATEGTVRGGAYLRAIHALSPDARVEQVACPLFVALAEEGWTEGPVPDQVAAHYLAPLQGRIDTLVLGCTHFPLLARSIAAAAGSEVRLVNSAETTATEVESLMIQVGLKRSGNCGTRSIRFLVTDAPERFLRVAPLFLSDAIAVHSADQIDL